MEINMYFVTVGNHRGSEKLINDKKICEEGNTVIRLLMGFIYKHRLSGVSQSEKLLIEQSTSLKPVELGIINKLKLMKG